MDLYEKYILERNNERMYKTDVGFCTYLIQDNILYIADIYTVPDQRNKGVATTMADSLLEEVRKHTKITHVQGSISLDDPNYIRNEKVLIGYGMQPLAEREGLMYFIKEV